MHWSPSIKINPNYEETIQAAREHFEELKKEYGPLVMVNLIDKKSQ